MTSRFLCPSISLSLSRLLVKSRHVLLLCMAGAVMIHFSLGWLNVLQQEEKVVKPLTTQFIKRQPRLTKPLEMKKKPRPKRRRIQRQMVSIKARVSRQQVSSSVRPIQVIENLARPKASVTRSVSFTGTDMEPSAIAEMIEGTREPENAVDMSLEMLNIDALDTGQHHAMIILEGDDKRSVRGFFHMAFAYSMTMSEAALTARHGNYVGRLGWAYVRLVEAMNKYTQVRTEFSDRFAFDSEELIKVPWIYAPSGAIGFKISESEAHSLGRYMTAGGFLLLDDLGHQRGRAGDVSLRQVFKDALETQGYRYGADWNFEVLPNSHHLYHCFFDFDHGPPRSWSDQGGYWTSGGKFVAPPDPTLDGVQIENRLVGVMSNQAFANAWGDWNQRGGYMGLDPTRPLQFGVNTIIFALTQEGSITNRVMNMVR